MKGKVECYFTVEHQMTEDEMKKLVAAFVDYTDWDIELAIDKPTDLHQNVNYKLVDFSAVLNVTTPYGIRSAEYGEGPLDPEIARDLQRIAAGWLYATGRHSIRRLIFEVQVPLV